MQGVHLDTVHALELAQNRSEHTRALLGTAFLVLPCKAVAHGVAFVARCASDARGARPPPARPLPPQLHTSSAALSARQPFARRPPHHTSLRASRSGTRGPSSAHARRPSLRPSPAPGLSRFPSCHFRPALFPGPPAAVLRIGFPRGSRQFHARLRGFGFARMYSNCGEDSAEYTLAAH